MKLDKVTQARSRLGDDQALATALSEFVLKTMDKPLTEGRIQKFLDRWRRARGDAFEKILKIRVRALVAIH